MSAPSELAGQGLAGLSRMEAGPGPERAPEGARRGQHLDWIQRPLFGLLLAAAALAALLAGGAWFAGFIALGTIAGLREWHRMVREGSFWPYTAVGGLAIAAALSLPVLAAHGVVRLAEPLGLGLAILFAAAVIDFGIALVRNSRAGRQAFGPLYVGVPGLALFALRATPDHGVWLVLILFAAIWASDTGALVSGRLIGGPKLAPHWSPNKTWAGLAGGTMMAAIAVAAIMLALGASAGRGAVFGIAIALIGGAGDLFESWVKRQVGRKDSGHLIPGHGGVLDRIDSILFAAPACALFVFLFGAKSIFGVTL